MDESHPRGGLWRRLSLDIPGSARGRRLVRQVVSPVQAPDARIPLAVDGPDRRRAVGPGGLDLDTSRGGADGDPGRARTGGDRRAPPPTDARPRSAVLGEAGR